MNLVEASRRIERLEDEIEDLKRQVLLLLKLENRRTMETLGFPLK